MHNYAKIHNFIEAGKTKCAGHHSERGDATASLYRRPSYPHSGDHGCEAHWSNLTQMTSQASIVADNSSVEFINYIIAKLDINIRHAFFWWASGLARCLSSANTTFIMHSTGATACQCHCLEVDDRDEVGGGQCKSNEAVYFF